MSAANCETVLITGASSGIGLELAKCFAPDKCRLVLIARNTEALETLASELHQAHGIEVRVLTADLALPETPKRIFEELRMAKISVDILVNNAGFGAQGAFARLSLQRQLEMIQVNIAALTELTGLFLPGMIERQRGGILNVGSVAGFLPGPNMGVYYATKAFVQSFTEALAEELSDSGLIVSVLCPGPTETNFNNIARGQKIRRLKTSKMSAQEVARLGHCAFRNRKVVKVTGLTNQLLLLFTRVSPRSLIRKMVKSYNTID